MINSSSTSEPTTALAASSSLVTLPTGGQVSDMHTHKITKPTTIYNSVATSHNANYTYVHVYVHVRLLATPLGMSDKTKIHPEASKGTKRQRSAQLAGVRELVSDSQEAATVQLQEEIRREGKEKLL